LSLPGLTQIKIERRRPGHVGRPAL